MRNKQDNWERYRNGDDLAFSDLVLQYDSLVKSTAASIAKTLPSHIDFDDLISDGYIGLMDAIRRYDSSYGYKFETYASFRIRGEIIDQLRHSDWAPRSLRSKNREVDLATEKLSRDLGRNPTATEVATLLGWSGDDLNRVVGASSTAVFTHLDELVNSDGDKFKLSDVIPDVSSQPIFFDVDDLNVIKDKISDSLSDLTEQQRVVFFLHYIEGLSLKDIGVMLDVTESRVCQIHTGALDSIWSSCLPG
jgi:RNA polymerase sigma factor for flagellar operon FliA